MSDTTQAPIDEPFSASPRRFLATFGAIVGLIVVFLVLDLAVANIERSETRKHAADLYAEGRALLAAGRAGEAADRLATAVSLERDSVPYVLARAQAMRAEGRVEDAEQVLTQLLVLAQNDGPVNLTMAQLLVATGRWNEAKAFYHRAIYGRWGSDSVTSRLATRFELIDLLAREGARSELLAELLPLESSRADSSAMLARLAPLYLIAGSPARAAEAYRQLSRRTPENVAAYAGMGEVALSEGEFQAARTAFANAARVRPGDSAIAVRLRLVDTLLALDPNARQLSDAARVNRSRALLGRALQSLESCVPLATPTDSPLRDSTRAELADVKQHRDAAASADRLLTLATSLWRMRTTACAIGSSESDDVLKRLLGS